MGRAIVRNPQVFLMDEPLSNLDAKLRVQMRAELQKLHRRLQATIVYVTHDQVEAMTLGGRIAIILNGELQQIDSPLTVYEKPLNRFVAGFIGSPPMNFIKGKITKSGETYSFESQSFKIEIPVDLELNEYLQGYEDKEMLFGIRPEDIWDVPSSGWIDKKFVLDTKVDFRELMGSETYVYLKAGEVPLVARVGAMADTKTGSNFRVVINLRKIHLFDLETQKAVI